MNKESSFIETKSYYELTHTESIPCKALYEKFLNWVSGEFELYLQDKLNGLQIFYPGGFIYINELDTNNTYNVGFKIVVKSKYQQKGIQIKNQLSAILSHIIRLKNRD